MTVAGLLLAAGAGRRMGMPKGLLRDAHDVPFVDRAVGVLLDGGCDAVTVVGGAAADAVTALLDEAGWTGDDAVDVVVAPDWEEGMGASLRRGLGHLATSTHDAALVSLVDLPDIDVRVVARVLAAQTGPGTLARSMYEGRPGHPVLLGREHWAGVVADAHGDQGARAYLAAHHVADLDCSDLATGRDVDRPHQL
ncbi:MAG: nucleotidyltransferase family protein [Nocardioidaceae bacterium]